MMLLVLLAAAECASCHATTHAEWAGSRHATAATNPLFLASHALHKNRAWCLTCHQPQSEGVGCASCHGEDPHAKRKEKVTCERCHDFNVPKAFGDPSQPMQDTADEWHRSKAAAEGKTCASCHDHRARSGHDAEVLAAALQVEVHRANGLVTARVRSADAGHAVPTGDPFRRLMLRAGELKKKVVVPVDGAVELKLGATPAKTWQLDYHHAEAELSAADHPFTIRSGEIIDD